MPTKKSMQKTTKAEKEIRSFAIDLAKSKLSSKKAIEKFYSSIDEFVQPSYLVLEGYYDQEDESNAKLKELYQLQAIAKKDKDNVKLQELTTLIEEAKAQKKAAQAGVKEETEKHVYFSRAAKPFLDADKMFKQKESYSHLEELTEKYEESKARYEKELAEKAEEAARKKAEEKAYDEKIKAEKAAKKAAKKK